MHLIDPIERKTTGWVTKRHLILEHLTTITHLLQIQHSITIQVTELIHCMLTVKQLERDTMVESPDGPDEHLTAIVVVSNQSFEEKEYLPGFGSGIQPDTEVLKPYWIQWPETDGGI